jgi:uncharacterized protein YlxW (UPF0749 family)
MSALKKSNSLDETTAIIVRMDEKVDRLEKDFNDLKRELRDIKAALAAMSTKMSENDGAVKASLWWIGSIAGAVSLVVGVGTEIIKGILFK